jgi:aspartate aminotransferase
MQFLLFLIFNNFFMNQIIENSFFTESINQHIADLSISETLAINEKSKKLIEEGKRIFRFGLGQSPFPVPDIVVDALKLYAPQKDYLDVKGLLQLRVAVADFHRKKDLVHFSPDNIMIGPGSKELLFLAQLAFDGDILITSPSWVSYLPQAKILGKEIKVIHADYKHNWCIQPEDLELACLENSMSKILILNYPGNPDGMTYSEEQLKALAVVAKKHKLIILSDEIYGQIHHQGSHISIARFYPEGTIISSGLSKWCGAGGWRLGTFSFPKTLDWLMNAMTVVASETFTSVSAPIQFAAITAFRGDALIEDYLWHVRRILSQLGNKCAQIFKDAGINVHYPLGGFYLFPDFTPLLNDLKRKKIDSPKSLCERLLDETGVAVLPGYAFNRPEDEFTIRMAYVDFDGAKALSASRNIPLNKTLPDDFSKLWCSNVIEGTQKMVDWIKK